MVRPRDNLKEYLTQLPEAPAHGGCGRCGIGEGAARSGDAPDKTYATTAVRFGYMRYIGEFTHPPDMKFACGAKIILQTKRGIELGEQVSLTCTDCDKSVTPEQTREWVELCGQDSYIFGAGRILREATASDLAEYARIQAGCREKSDFCQQVADRHGLPIRVVECESPFGGERIIFYFTAAERVDFRAMVRELAREYRTRIEMRQIGARDEARLLADYETCGREICCKIFLKTLRPISMRMAKVQKATLDPSQVSGRCGRLKCCLRYEHAGYEELDRSLPRVGVRIRTEHHEGVIVNRQILTQLVQIRTDAGVLVAVAAEDITEVDVPPPPAEEPPSEGMEERPPRKRRTGRQQTERRSEDRAREPATSKPTPEPPKTPERKEPDARPRNSADKPVRAEQAEEQTSRRRRRGRRRRRRRPRGDRPSGPAGGPSPSSGG
jgi:cell fate regulator YaaT (PSP1 superfamily)